MEIDDYMTEPRSRDKRGSNDDTGPTFDKKKSERVSVPLIIETYRETLSQVKKEVLESIFDRTAKQKTTLVYPVIEQKMNLRINHISGEWYGGESLVGRYNDSGKLASLPAEMLVEILHRLLTQ